MPNQTSNLMRLHKFLIFIFVVVSPIKGFAQIVVPYRVGGGGKELQTEFLPALYAYSINLIHFKVYDNAHQLLPNEGLKMEADSAFIEYRGYYGTVNIVPRKNVSIVRLKAYYQGKFVQELVWKVLKMPLAKLYLKKTYLDTNPLNTNKPIKLPSDSILYVGLDWGKEFNDNCHYLRGTQMNISLLQWRSGRLVQVIPMGNTLDFKEFNNIKENDKFEIVLKEAQRLPPFFVNV
jgi:hypothetical protein